VMRHHLDRCLSAQYGVALYYSRPISSIMDRSPLVVEADAPVEIVADRAMQRKRDRLYDHVIVVRNGAVMGVISVRALLDTMTRLQVEIAKGVNPLTGLPGNVLIEQELMARVRSSQACAFIYADLDNFKPFNDRYGFARGDQLILFLARVLERGVRKYAGNAAFLGHVGGDDFVVMADPARVEELCTYVIRLFDRGVRFFYSPEDRQRRGHGGRDRESRERFFPLVSVSLAIVECRGNCTYADIVERAAQLKRYAKNRGGSTYVADRRGAAP